VNCNPKTLECSLWSRKLIEIRVAGRMLGLLEQQEPPGSTLVVIRCHTRAANFMCFGAQWWLGN